MEARHGVLAFDRDRRRLLAATEDDDGTAVASEIGAVSPTALARMTRTGREALSAAFAFRKGQR